jgi:hypothetical protein
MIVHMAPQDIFKKIKAKPFHPFRVHISDGSSYDVLDSVYAFMTSPTELAIGVDPDGESGLPQRSVYIAPNHVTRIEPIVSQSQ